MHVYICALPTHGQWGSRTNVNAVAGAGADVPPFSPHMKMMAWRIIHEGDLYLSLINPTILF